MIGYTKPKELNIRKITDELGNDAYILECSDSQPDEYSELAGNYYATEEDARIEAESIEWQRQIKQDLKELNELRDELLAKEAVIGARLGRIIKQLNGRDDPDEFPESFGGMTAEAYYGMQEYDRKLRTQIEELDRREERINSIIAQRQWGTGLGAERNSHIDTCGSIHFDNKEKLYYIELIEETDGITKRITGKTIEEVREKISIEDDRLRVKQGVIPESGSNSYTILMADRSIARLSAAETRYLLELYNLAIFGSEVDRKAAREKIFEMLGLNGSLEKMNELEQRKKTYMLQEAASGANDKWDKYTFSAYIWKYLDSKKLTKQELANRIGVNRSTIARYTNGEMLPTKDIARKLAAAMELTVNDMRIFINSAGHSFPNKDDKTDSMLIVLVSEGGHKWYELLAALGVGGEDDGAERNSVGKAKGKNRSHRAADE